jgi:histidine triad (HIT) family protein
LWSALASAVSSRSGCKRWVAGSDSDATSGGSCSYREADQVPERREEIATKICGMRCVFCAIVSGDAPARRVYEDRDTLAFLDIAPATRGHTLVIPKHHAEDIWSISEDAAQAVAVATLRVAHLMRTRLGVAGVNVMQANGRLAWQEVFHLHAHVVPRYPGDELRRAWSPVRAADGDLDAVHAQLQSDE